MLVLLDTNVVLDILLQREPWEVQSRRLWQLMYEGQITGYLTASALTDVFYIVRRLTGLETAYNTVRMCLAAFEICAVDRHALEQALTLPGNDFEDNLQIACAILYSLDAIVTRDLSGFQGAVIPVLTPHELLTRLGP